MTPKCPCSKWSFYEFTIFYLPIYPFAIHVIAFLGCLEIFMVLRGQIADKKNPFIYESGLYMRTLNTDNKL